MKKHRPTHEAETMGLPERRAFVATLDCAACGRHASERFPSQNAHVLPKRETGGGMGRKGSHTGIAPLCTAPRFVEGAGTVAGCHQLFDEFRSVFGCVFPHFTPSAAAAATDAACLLHQRAARALPGEHQSNG